MEIPRWKLKKTASSTLKRVSQFKTRQKFWTTLLILALILSPASTTFTIRDPLEGKEPITPNFQSLANNPHHYVAFDNLGEMAAAMGYIHVAIPLDLTKLIAQIKKLHSKWSEIEAGRYHGLALHGVSGIPNIPENAVTIYEALEPMKLRVRYMHDLVVGLDQNLPQDSDLATRESEQNQFKRESREGSILLKILEPNSTLIENHEEVLADLQLDTAELSYLTQTLDLTLQLPHQPRVPRTVPVLSLATGFLSGVLGTFLGVYSAVEISNLKNRLAQMDGVLKNLIIMGTKHEEKFVAITSELERMVQEASNMQVSIYDLQQHVPLRFYAKVHEEVEMVGEKVRSIVNAVQQLQHRRLSIDLIDHVDMKRMYEEVKQLAEKSHHALLSKHFSDFYQLEVTYLRKELDITILLHVPCVNLDTTLTLYRYIPFPIPLPAETSWDSDDLYEVFFPGKISSRNPAGPKFNYSRTMEALYVIPEAEIIAIGHTHAYKLISDSELSRCEQHRSMVLCDKHQVLRTRLADSCLGSLYSRNIVGVREHCKFEKRAIRETVYQLSPTQHLVYSPSEITSQINCADGRKAPVHLGKSTLLTVPVDCEVQLTSHLIRSDFFAKVGLPPLHFNWEWDPLSLPAEVLNYRPPNSPSLAKLKQEVSELKNVTAKEARTNEFKLVLSHILSDHTSYPWYFWLVAAVLILVSVIVVTWCLGNAWMLHRRRQLIRKTIQAAQNAIDAAARQPYPADLERPTRPSSTLEAMPLMERPDTSVAPATNPRYLYPSCPS